MPCLSVSVRKVRNEASLEETSLAASYLSGVLSVTLRRILGSGSFLLSLGSFTWGKNAGGTGLQQRQC